MFTLTLSFVLWLFFRETCFYSFLFVRIPLAGQWIGGMHSLGIERISLSTKILFSFNILSLSKRRQLGSLFDYWFLLYDLSKIFTSVLQWEFLDSLVKIRWVVTIRIKPRGLCYGPCMCPITSFMTLNLV